MKDHFGVGLAIIQMVIVGYLLFEISQLSSSLNHLGLSLTGISLSYTIPAALLLILGLTFLIKNL